ncbi:MAG: hypothetical protein AABY10_01685 [Nanoarchaeota archaeon]
MTGHENIIKEMHEQLKDIFDSSEQGMYLYLDDEHKVCNENFASMLDYDSVDEWVAVKENFPEAFVAEESQETLVNTFREAMENGIGSQIMVKWKTKSGEHIKSTVILVPISYRGHRMALHFVFE